jgi:hypothetical protein
MMVHRLFGPVNDLCAGAISVSCGDAVSGTTVGATAAGAPATCVTSLNTAPGLWYRITGTGDNVTASLAGSAYDTKIGVFTGSCGALTCVTGNDDFGGLQSQVTFSGVAGTDYYIYVTGFQTQAGAFTLTMTCVPPPCASATPISCGDVVTGTTVGAALDGSVGTCGTALNTAPGVYYVVQGTGTDITASLCGSAYDTKIGVFSGSCGSPLTCVTGNDDFCGLQSEVTFPSTVGTNYYIYVTGYQTQTGAYTLAVSCDVPDCNGDLNGSAIVDNCGNCVEGNTGLTACVADCNGDFGGTAILDNCGICVEGNTGLIACEPDCNGDLGGSAVFDNCGICVGGNTGLIACVQDCNGEFGGTAFIDNCGDCVGGTTGQVACPFDCNGEDGGTAFLDNCNVCVGGSTGLTACVADCNGDFGGTAVLDNCGTCVDGNTGLTACVADCNGDFGGTAVLDNCGTCVDGNTGITACVADCNGDFGGTAVLDNCGDCVGGNTGLTACAVDCNGDAGGTAVVDNCGDCVGGNTGLAACVQDCNGDFGGSAVIDDCGDCVGGNTGLSACTPVSVSDLAVGSLQIYPNPNNGVFIIEINGVDGAGTINIMDMMGRRVYTQGANFNGSFRQSIELNVAKGTYVLQVITESGIAVRKVELQ